MIVGTFLEVQGCVLVRLYLLTFLLRFLFYFLRPLGPERLISGILTDKVLCIGELCSLTSVDWCTLSIQFLFLQQEKMLMPGMFLGSYWLSCNCLLVIPSVLEGSQLL